MEPLLGFLLASGSYTMIVVGLRIVHRLFSMSPEAERKLMHVAAGTCLLPLPWMFHSDILAILLFSVFIIGPFYAKKFAWTNRVFGRTLDVKRKNIGGSLFGLGLLSLYALTQQTPLYYLIAAMVLVYADAAAAMVGVRWRIFPYRLLGSEKTFSGSAAFFIVASACIFLPLAVATPDFALPILLVSVIIAALTTFVEAISPYGLDNLFIPLFVFAMLHSFHHSLYVLASNLLLSGFY